MSQYLLFDEQYQYHFRNDRMETAERMNFDFISQCTIELYKKHKSCIKVGRLLAIHKDTVRYEIMRLKHLGVDINLNSKGATRKYNHNIESSQIIAEYQKYKSIIKVAQTLNTSIYLVYKILRQHNISRRGEGKGTNEHQAIHHRTV